MDVPAPSLPTKLRHWMPRRDCVPRRTLGWISTCDCSHTPCCRERIQTARSMPDAARLACLAPQALKQMCPLGIDTTAEILPLTSSSTRMLTVDPWSARGRHALLLRLSAWPDGWP